MRCTEFRDGPTLARRDANLGRATEAAVGGAFGVTLAELRSHRRCAADIAGARQSAMYLLHVGFGRPYAAVGQTFGRDRTTVAHACRLIEERRDQPRYDEALSALEAGLVAWSLRFADISFGDAR